MADIQITGKQIKQLDKKAVLDGTESYVLQDSTGTKQVDSSVLKEWVKPDLSAYALKTEIPSIAGLLSKTQADELYQAKGSYATTQQLSTKINGVGVTEIQIVDTLPEVQQDGILYIVLTTEAA